MLFVTPLITDVFFDITLLDTRSALMPMLLLLLLLPRVIFFAPLLPPLYAPLPDYRFDVGATLNMSAIAAAAFDVVSMPLMVTCCLMRLDVDFARCRLFRLFALLATMSILLLLLRYAAAMYATPALRAMITFADAPPLLR